MIDDAFPDDRLYDASGQMWYQPLGDGTWRIGMTPLGRRMVGRVLAFMPRPEGRHIELDRAFATIESGKWVGAARLVFAATITATHDDLIDQPEPINRDPLGDGWLVVVRPDDEAAARTILVDSHGDFPADIPDDVIQ